MLRGARYFLVWYKAATISWASLVMNHVGSTWCHEWTGIAIDIWGNEPLYNQIPFVGSDCSKFSEIHNMSQTCSMGFQSDECWRTEKPTDSSYDLWPCQLYTRDNIVLCWNNPSPPCINCLEQELYGTPVKTQLVSLPDKFLTHIITTSLHDILLPTGQIHSFIFSPFYYFC